LFVRLCAVEKERYVAVTEQLQVATAASQTDEDVTAREQLHHISLGTMIFEFLAHTVDIKRSNLTDKLVEKNILSPAEKQQIKQQKKTDAKLKILLMKLREKSADQFESFLTTLGETGHQSIPDAVRQALHAVGQTGHNPLQRALGNEFESNFPTLL